MTLRDIAHGPRDRPLPMVAPAARTHELDVPAEFESIKSIEELHGRAGEHLEIGSCDAREQQQIHKGRTLPLAGGFEYPSSFVEEEGSPRPAGESGAHGPRRGAECPRHRRLCGDGLGCMTRIIRGHGLALANSPGDVTPRSHWLFFSQLKPRHRDRGWDGKAGFPESVLGGVVTLQDHAFSAPLPTID